MTLRSQNLRYKKMKPKIIKLSTGILLFLFVGASCQKEKNELPPLENKILSIIETNFNGCKESLKSSETERYVELKAEGENQLRLKFINARINCAGLDTTYAAINDGILKVTFFDYNLANCLCDFDLDCVIDSMENREYNLEVYAHGEEPKAKFTFTYSSMLDSKFILY